MQSVWQLFRTVMQDFPIQIKFYFSIRKYPGPTKHASIKNKTDIKKTETPSWKQVWRFVKCCIIMKTYFRCILHRKCKCHCSNIGNKNNIWAVSIQLGYLSEFKELKNLNYLFHTFYPIYPRRILQLLWLSIAAPVSKTSSAGLACD